MLILHGADVGPDVAGRTPLAEAAMEGHLNVVRVLSTQARPSPALQKALIANVRLQHGNARANELSRFFITELKPNRRRLRKKQFKACRKS